MKSEQAVDMLYVCLLNPFCQFGETMIRWQKAQKL